MSCRDCHPPVLCTHNWLCEVRFVADLFCVHAHLHTTHGNTKTSVNLIVLWPPHTSRGWPYQHTRSGTHTCRVPKLRNPELGGQNRKDRQKEPGALQCITFRRSRESLAPPHPVRRCILVDATDYHVRGWAADAPSHPPAGRMAQLQPCGRGPCCFPAEPQPYMQSRSTDILGLVDKPTPPHNLQQCPLWLATCQLCRTC